MLTTLRIKNLALVADLTLELQAGCNVITGETGAGKSILIGALNLILGERADRTLIRSGSDGCSVEAVFDISGLRTPLGALLESNGLEACEDDQLVLKRALTISGANRQFVNGSPATLAALAALGELLVDIHGPHDHQSLLHPARQLSILDAFGGLEKERESFGGLMHRRAELEREKAALIVDEKTYAQQLDLLRFQVDEIGSAKFQPGEEAAVEQDYQRASNAAKLLQLAQSALDLLAENDQSLLTQAGSLGRTLQDLQRIDPETAVLTDTQVQAVGLLRDLQSGLSRYLDKVDLDPERMAQLEARLDLIHALKRKYGASLAEVLQFGESARHQLHSLEQRDSELVRLNGQLSRLDMEILEAGRELSSQRNKVVPALRKAVSGQLADLGFKQSRFDVAITTPEFSTMKAGGGGLPAQAAPKPQLSGFDTVEYQFAPNPGEPAKALRAIASSGELARVMLALKTVLAGEDEIPVLVFDEVDANVGGETAHAVGEKMRQIACKRQVLCITHLPQVAASGHAHFLVAKQLKDGRTVSEMRLLERKERVAELARMLGGQSEAARRHAEALLKGK